MYLANKNIPEALILKIEYYPCFKPGVNASQGNITLNKCQYKPRCLRVTSVKHCINGNLSNFNWC